MHCYADVVVVHRRQWSHSEACDDASVFVCSLPFLRRPDALPVGGPSGLGARSSGVRAHGSTLSLYALLRSR